MTVTAPRRQWPPLASSTRRRPTTKRSRKNNRIGSTYASSLKASLMGGFGIWLLMLISLIPAPFLAWLVIPGFVVVCFCTGLIAGILAGDQVKTSHQGGQTGWIAGFWAGIYGGVMAMLLAAAGLLMAHFGQGVVNQFTPDQVEGLVGFGLTPEDIALTGRVFGALIIYGLIGALLSGLFSAIGGMVLYHSTADP